MNSFVADKTAGLVAQVVVQTVRELSDLEIDTVAGGFGNSSSRGIDDSE